MANKNLVLYLKKRNETVSQTEERMITWNMYWTTGTVSFMPNRLIQWIDLVD